MDTVKLDGCILKSMLINGCRNSRFHRNAVNELNVFPIPDGDTGTNMNMTMESGLKAVEAVNTTHIGEFLKLFSKGALFGARGNSGIILAQYIQGIAQYSLDKETLTTSEFCEALSCGVKKAYEAVMTPVEGTMLTVMRVSSQRIAKVGNADCFETLFSLLIAEMKQTLQETPDLLPILKEAGVVDSGGLGLVYIIDGMAKALDGKIIDEADESTADIITPTSSASLFNEDTEMVYGYCTEFILQLQRRKVDLLSFDLNALKSFLENVGNSVVALRTENIVKVHVHTFEPEKVLAYGRNFGEFLTIKIENMSLQHNETLANVKHKEYAVVAVCSGNSIASYFLEIGVDVIIDGGQTNNPSVNDFINAFKKVSATNIIVLPNNGNILMAAKQAAKMYDDANIVIVPTKTIAEGYSAISMMDLSLDTVDAVVAEMQYAVDNVLTGEVTYAIRDARVNGFDIKAGQYIGLDGKTICAVGDDRIKVAVDLVAVANADGSKQVVTAFCGKGVTEDDCSRLSNMLSARFPLIELGLIEGDQDIYSFILAIE